MTASLPLAQKIRKGFAEGARRRCSQKVLAEASQKLLAEGARRSSSQKVLAEGARRRGSWARRKTAQNQHRL